MRPDFEGVNRGSILSWALIGSRPEAVQPEGIEPHPDLSSEKQNLHRTSRNLARSVRYGTQPTRARNNNRSRPCVTPGVWRDLVSLWIYAGVDADGGKSEGAGRWCSVA